MSNARAVVLAGGKGIRMNSSTPKILHDICGRPMFGWVVNAIFLSGIQDISVVIPSEIDSLSMTKSTPYPIKFVKQNQPLGTGQALMQATKHIEVSDGNILVINGDAPLIKAETLTSFMKCHEENDAVVTVMTCNGFPSQGMGSIVRDLTGNRVLSIIESRDIKDAGGLYTESNVGAYLIKLSWLLKNVNDIPGTKDGQFYVTSLIDMACTQGLPAKSYCILDESEASGVNNGVEMSKARNILQNRINDYWLMNGVNLIGPTHIDVGASIGADCTIFPNTFIYGKTVIDDNSSIGPGSIIKDTSIGSRCNITQSVVENAVIEDNVRVGPFSHIRSDSHIDSGVSIGNYAEIKNTYIGQKTLVGHFSYLGDARIGSNVNIGAGSITCNFDGVTKHQTIIENDVFIGSDSILIAPVRIGSGASTGAGCVVTRDVPSGAKVVGMPARIINNRSPINKNKKPTI